jgi:hypothetical protein
MNKYMILAFFIFVLFYAYMMMETVSTCDKKHRHHNIISYEKQNYYPYIDETILYDRSKSLNNYEYEQLQYDKLRRNLL